jgi:hypothetical protein
VRGWQLSPAAKRLDIVVVAARYDLLGKLTVAQGFERRGQVWSDLILVDRDTLIRNLRSRRRVAVAVPTPVPGDFEIVARVRLEGKNGVEFLASNSAHADQDHLPAPLF